MLIVKRGDLLRLASEALNVARVREKHPRRRLDRHHTSQDQITSAVRWVDCMERLAPLGCDLFVELGPGGVLAGLFKRTRKDIDAVSVSDVASVRACAERLRRA